MDPAVALTTFVLIFPAELPDKTFVATLVLSTRHPGRWVWMAGLDRVVRRALRRRVGTLFGVLALVTWLGVLS